MAYGAFGSKAHKTEKGVEMKKLPSILVTIAALGCFFGTGVLGQSAESETTETAQKSRLAVL